MADEHKAYLPAYKYHASVGSYDGGACLMKHVTQYKDNDSCSYRWQGVKKATEQPGRAAYDAHPNSKRHIGGRSAGPFAPSSTSGAVASPGMAGSVVVSGIQTKKGLRDIVEVTNFTTGFAPYGNQVHHVLNASSLRNGIDELAKTWYPIRWVIVNGLLGEKYNLNHKDNNMILPTRDVDSAHTGLPKHYGSHPTYSKQILAAVKSALKPYKKIANQMKKKRNHDKLEPEKLKTAFESISKSMYSSILGMAAANRAKRAATKINELPSKAYAGI